MPSAAPESSSCSTVLCEQAAGVVADEAERVGERPRPELVAEDHAAARRVHGVSARCASTSSPSAASARSDREPAGGDQLGLEDVVLDRDEDRRAEPLGMTNAATVARLIVVTVAMRRPAMIAGSASGSSTRQRICGA